MDKKKAIVMGATSGIGLEVARLLARQGWTVGIAGRRVERLEALLAEEDNVSLAKCIDITAEEAPLLLQEMITELGGVDLYLHSSGIGWQNIALDAEMEMLTVQTNAVGFTRMLTSVFNAMKAQGGGHIACITSIAGTKGLGAAPAYSATKRYQNHYLECLTQLARMSRLPIIITDIRPGFVDTALIANSNYPLKLRADKVAEDIVEAIGRGKGVKVIDWRYRLLVFLWRMIPRWLWVRIPVK